MMTENLSLLYGHWIPQEKRQLVLVQFHEPRQAIADAICQDNLRGITRFFGYASDKMDSWTIDERTTKNHRCGRRFGPLQIPERMGFRFTRLGVPEAELSSPSNVPIGWMPFECVEP